MLKCEEAKSKYYADLKEKLDLRKLCWETMFGQEMVKLTVMDMVVLFFTTIIGDLFRFIIAIILY